MARKWFLPQQIGLSNRGALILEDQAVKYFAGQSVINQDQGAAPPAGAKNYYSGGNATNRSQRGLGWPS